MTWTEPVPPQAPKGDALGRLQRELWHARDTGETRLAQDLMQRIGRLRTDQADGTEPQREDTAAANPRRETTRRTATPRKTAARKPNKPRSTRVPRQ